MSPLFGRMLPNFSVELLLLKDEEVTWNATFPTFGKQLCLSTQ